MFWLAFGTAAAVIGLALMTIGVTRSPSGTNLFTSTWFDVGIGLLVLGALLLLWALLLYVARRKGQAQAAAGGGSNVGSDWKGEAVKGYYRERQDLFRAWQRDQKQKKGQKKPQR